jgi:tRNA 2-selenouridine synthase
LVFDNKAMAFHSLNKIDIEKFMALAATYPVADVRSPSEFRTGHIPGSFNIPLFDDEERAIVGTKYKKEGRRNAILKGIELTGPAMHKKLQSALKIAKDNKILVHCWRGGMRSEAMAWLFSLGDISTEVLEGGYKSYRHHVLSELTERKKVIVLGGMTGSSKTHILNHIGNLHHQVIDLERLANHKGSAFGSLGQLPQPSSEHFSNLLHDQWEKTNKMNPVWLEDESRNIGTVFMPDNFYEHIRLAPTIVLVMGLEKRLPRLLEEYSTYPKNLLRESVLRISKRLGGDNARDAITAIDVGDFAKAIEITLKYYDKTYMFSILKNHSGQIIYIETDTNDIEANADKVLEASRQITF